MDSMDPKLGVAIDEAEALYEKDTQNIAVACDLVSLYLDANSLPTAFTILQSILERCKGYVPLEGTTKIFIEVLFRYLRSDRFTNKSNMLLNFSAERRAFWSECAQFCSRMMKEKKYADSRQYISFKAACAKETLGEFQDALAILSDLITENAMEDVDLSFIIFKASIILKHIGQTKQAIEYLEYLLDDPPATDGFNKAHVVAALALIYEQTGGKYEVFVSSTYKSLQGCYVANLMAHGTVTVARKGEEVAKDQNFHQSSEVWETFALQAIDRCEYVMAVEFILQAITKAPKKGKLLQVLAEIYYVLGENDLCGKYGEKALIMLPKSADLRNLLILVDPEKWTAKLRSAASVHQTGSAASTAVTATDKRGSRIESERAAPTKVLKPQSKIQRIKPESEKDKSPPKPAGKKPVTAAVVEEEEDQKGLMGMLKRGLSKRVLSSKNIAQDINDAALTAKKEAPAGVGGAASSRPATTAGWHSKKPLKPELTPEARRCLDLSLKGKTQLHHYDPDLAVVASLRAATSAASAKGKGAVEASVVD